MSVINSVDRSLYTKIISFPEGDGSMVLIALDPNIAPDLADPVKNLVMIYLVLNDQGAAYYCRPVSDVLNYQIKMDGTHLTTFASQLGSLKSSNVVVSTSLLLPEPPAPPVEEDPPVVLT